MLQRFEPLRRTTLEANGLRVVSYVPGNAYIVAADENAAAADVELSDEDMRRLDQAMPVGATSGTRYPEASMAAVNG